MIVARCYLTTAASKETSDFMTLYGYHCKHLTASLHSEVSFNAVSEEQVYLNKDNTFPTLTF